MLNISQKGKEKKLEVKDVTRGPQMSVVESIWMSDPYQTSPTNNLGLRTKQITKKTIKINKMK